MNIKDLKLEDVISDVLAKEQEEEKPQDAAEQPEHDKEEEPVVAESDEETKEVVEESEDAEAEHDKEEPVVAESEEEVPAAAPEEKEYKLSEELEGLVDGELSADLKEKIDAAFDTIVAQKVEKIKEELEVKNEEELKESIKQLQKAVGIYLEKAASQYVMQNRLAIKESLRQRYFESFFGKLKTLFKENYVELPEEDETVVADLQKENEELKDKADELVKETEELKESVIRLQREKQIAKAASDMYLTESERFKIASSKLLNESVKKLSDEEFAAKLKTISEMFAKSKQKSSAKKPIVEAVKTKQITESKEDAKKVHPDVAALLNSF